MAERWFPIDCAECRGPLLRVEVTSTAAPQVQVRHRSRRGGPDRTSWVPVQELPGHTAPTVYCDAHHVFDFTSADDLRERAVAAVLDAAGEGAERALLPPVHRGDAWLRRLMAWEDAHLVQEQPASAAAPAPPAAAS